jgi:hypothetical protein
MSKNMINMINMINNFKLFLHQLFIYLSFSLRLFLVLLRDIKIGFQVIRYEFFLFFILFLADPIKKREEN